MPTSASYQLERAGGWNEVRPRGTFSPMLGLTGGEIFVIAFIVGAILSARFWPLLGERLVALFARSERRR